jgi:hydroxypyruvate isomerase
VQIVLINMPAGNWEAGERGLIGLPGREQEFRGGVAEAVTYAKALGVMPKLLTISIALSGAEA